MEKIVIKKVLKQDLPVEEELEELEEPVKVTDDEEELDNEEPGFKEKEEEEVPSEGDY